MGEFKESHMIDELSRVDIPACKSSMPLNPRPTTGRAPSSISEGNTLCHPESKTFFPRETQSPL